MFQKLRRETLGITHRLCSCYSQTSTLRSSTPESHYVPENVLKHYPVLYTGEIGRVRDYSSRLITLHPAQEEIIRTSPDLRVYKYGTSSDVWRRTKEHNRQFKYFELKVLKGTLRHLELEQMITRELKCKNLLYKLMVRGNETKMLREIVCFSEEWQKEWYVDLIDDLINKQLMSHILVDENTW